MPLGAGDGTQHFMVARQGLYPLSHIPQPLFHLCEGYFRKELTVPSKLVPSCPSLLPQPSFIGPQQSHMPAPELIMVTGGQRPGLGLDVLNSPEKR